MQDVVRRTPRAVLHRLSEVLVFARFGRSDAEGAFATCHCLTLPESEPGYFFWRDRTTGELTRRSEWFVTKSPTVRLGDTAIKYLISFVLPRFCDQSLDRSRKAELYPDGTPAWIAKLDTVIHELYHIDPEETGIRRFVRADGTDSMRSHGPLFYEQVAEMVKAYLATDPDPALLRVPAARLRRAQPAAWRCARHDVPQLPVVPAALHGASRDAAVGLHRARRAAQAADAAGRLHRGRPARPAVHRIPRPAVARASAGPGGLTYRHASRADEPRRPVPDADPLDADLTARARRVDERVAADQHPDVRGARRLGAEEHQVARLRARPASRRTPDRTDSPTVRGTESPCCVEDVPDEAAAIEPVDGSAPPLRYGVPRNAERRAGDRVAGCRAGRS